jgi:hypothetical protein
LILFRLLFRLSLFPLTLWQPSGRLLASSGTQLLRILNDSGLFRRSCLLDGPDALQHVVELALFALQVRVATDVFLTDEDVGDAALAGQFFKSVLKGGAIICRS